MAIERRPDTQRHEVSLRLPELNLHVHVHIADLEILTNILGSKFDSILQGVQQLMAKIDDLRSALTDIGKDVTTIVTNSVEIDGDIQEVLDKLAALGTGGATDAQVQELIDLVTPIKTSTGDLVKATRATADKVPEPPTV